MLDPTVKKVSQAVGYKNRCASAFSTPGNRLKRNSSEECSKCLFKNTLPLSDKHHHHCQESNWEEALCTGRRGLGFCTPTLQNCISERQHRLQWAIKLLKETKSSDIKIQSLHRDRVIYHGSSSTFPQETLVWQVMQK